MSVVVLAVGLLPACGLKNMLLTLLRPSWSIARSARIQPNVFWGVGKVRLGANAYIGPGNVFRRLVAVELADDAEIGQFNWFSAAALYVDQEDDRCSGRLMMSTGSVITARHYVDCSGGVALADLAAIGGVRCTVLSHSVNIRIWGQEAAPVAIGRASIVFTNSVVTAGTTIAERCVVAPGSVVAKDLVVPERLYGGAPAKEVADLTGAGAFDRTSTRDVSRDDVSERLIAQWRERSAVEVGNGSRRPARDLNTEEDR